MEYLINAVLHLAMIGAQIAFRVGIIVATVVFNVTVLLVGMAVAAFQNPNVVLTNDEKSV